MRFEIRKVEGNLVVMMEGALDEALEASLEALAKRQKKVHIEFDMFKVTTANSVGIRVWAKFLEELAKTNTFEFQRCPSTYVDYCNLLPQKVFAKQVVSIAVPYECGKCGHVDTPILQVDDLDEELSLPGRVCVKCNGSSHPAVDASDYLEFINLTAA